MKWVVKQCNICCITTNAKTKAPVILILSGWCLDCIQFNLIDFQSVLNTFINSVEFKWILQIKDTFLKHV
jgi:hypothetical protein